MIDASEKGAILDAPLTSTGLLAGVAAFVGLEIVLSAPMWVGVVTGLAVIGLYDFARVIVSPVRASLREAPATRGNAAGLTKREVEVLTLLAEGLRNAQIADRLVVSEKTVDHHVSAILRKLDARTRGEASAQAARLGLTSAN